MLMSNQPPKHRARPSVTFRNAGPHVIRVRSSAVYGWYAVFWRGVLGQRGKQVKRRHLHSSIDFSIQQQPDNPAYSKYG